MNIEKEPNILKKSKEKEEENEKSQKIKKLYQKAIEENKKLPGKIWIDGWIEQGGQLGQECEEFFEGEVSASEAVNFFVEKGEFKKPINKEKIKELKESDRKEEAGIEIIQDLPLSVRDKVELLLCFLEEKPATTFINEKYQLHPEVSEGFAKLLQKKEKIIKENLDALNLVYETATTSSEDKSFQLFHISKSREILRKLIESWDKDDDEQIGLLYGYPKSAIDAWVKGAQEIGGRPPLGEGGDNPYGLKRGEIPNYFLREKKEEIENIVKFANFNFSREHWQEELNELRRTVEIIKKKVPKLYQSFLMSEDL